jgi:hypothetical protein
VEYTTLSDKDIKEQVRIMLRQAELAHLQLSIDQDLAAQVLEAETDPDRRVAVENEMAERARTLELVVKRIEHLKGQLA